MQNMEFRNAVKLSLIDFAVKDGQASTVMTPSTGGSSEVYKALQYYGMWYMHDRISQLPWEEQCKVIAAACGPTVHTIRLMALAWAMYDGWVAYMQKHKHAPVDVEQYLIDAMSADDMRSVLEKEY